jgi:hypothetical protein
VKYGPNTPAVEAVIERAGQLTPAEAESESLYAAWTPDRAAARRAARGTVWDAAREDAWGVAWSAAWHASRDAAWVSVRDAVLAELVRDLISGEHYETLTGPWKSVVEGDQS